MSILQKGIPGKTGQIEAENSVYTQNNYEPFQQLLKLRQFIGADFKAAGLLLHVCKTRCILLRFMAIYVMLLQ